MYSKELSASAPSFPAKRTATTARRKLARAHTSLRLSTDTAVFIHKSDASLGCTNVGGYLLNPRSRGYMIWWYFTTLCSVVTGFFTPWEVAFTENPGLSLYDDATAGIEYFLSLIFIIDIIVLFHVPQGRHDGLLETSRSRVAWHYFRTWFPIDLLGLVPFGTMVGSVWGETETNHFRALGLLRLFRLVRLRRLFTLFQQFETNISFSLMVTTLTRNISIVIIVGHFAGCMFYFTSVFYGRDSDTWIGASRDIEELTDLEKYIHSFYYSITTMTTVGYGDYSPKNTAEIVFATIYMIFNIVLNSYILGTITMVVSKADEKSGTLRDMYGKLSYFSQLNNLDQEHTQAIKNYIQFNLENPNLQDEDLFKNVPLGTRRMVLKSMYLPALEKLDIFQSVSRGFMMRMLENAVVDLYMPDQEMIAVGDYVHELHILLTGSAVINNQGTLTTIESVHGEGHPFLIDNFFTMKEVQESIRSECICRVLLISRSSYLNACEEFPRDSKLMQINTDFIKRDSKDSNFSEEQTQANTPLVVAYGNEWDSDTSKNSSSKQEFESGQSSSSVLPHSSQDQ